MINKVKKLADLKEELQTLESREYRKMCVGREDVLIERIHGLRFYTIPLAEALEQMEAVFETIRGNLCFHLDDLKEEVVLSVEGKEICKLTLDLELISEDIIK